MAADYIRDMKHVVKALERAKARDNDRKCILLVGAGCSVTAGIPAADGFVELICDRFSEEHKNAEKRAEGDPSKMYALCMEELDEDDRHELIVDQVKNKPLNWAHIAMAQLIKEDYIDIVLTTNFDNLIVRACALLGEYPAIYDFTTSQDFTPQRIADRSVFYLHGQYTGFAQSNTENETDKQTEKLRLVFKEALAGRVVIVVGYSGESDPLSGLLEETRCFGRRLYWIGYKSPEPPAHLRQELLQKGRDAHYIDSQGADDFFVQLSRGLNCFPPELFEKPLTHLGGILDGIPKKYPESEQEIGFLKRAREKIQKAIEEYEKEQAPGSTSTPEQESQQRVRAIEEEMLAGRYQEAVNLVPERAENIPPELAEISAWACINWGNTISEQAKTRRGEEADKLFLESYRYYTRAAEIKCDLDAAYYNWGEVLTEHAELKTGDVADELYEEACAKCAHAAEVNPKSGVAYYNWGNALTRQARTKSGDKADELHKQACAKYAKAVDIDPKNYMAYGNWGNALSERAKNKTGEEADRLFQEAYKKYTVAARIRPSGYLTYYNYGDALLDQAKTKTGKEAEGLFRESYALNRTILNIEPDFYKAHNNCGYALFNRAKTKNEEEKDRLLEAAFDHYRQAAEIEPTEALIHENWGNALLLLAGSKAEPQKTEILTQALARFLEVERIQPGRGSYNLACVAALQGDEEACKSWLEKSRDAGELPTREHLEGDSDMDSVRVTEWFTALLETL